MNPAEIRLVGALTEAEFRSLISDETQPEQSVRISAEAQKAISQLELDNPIKARRHLKLLTYLYTSTMSKQHVTKIPIDQKLKLRSILEIFKSIYSSYEPNTSEKLMIARLNIMLTLSSEESNEVARRIESEFVPLSNTPPPPLPEEELTKHTALPLQSFKRTAYNLFNTGLARYVYVPNPEATKYFKDNKHSVDDAYHPLIQHLLASGTFLGGYDVKELLNILVETYKPLKVVFFREGVDTPDAKIVEGRKPSKIIRHKLGTWKARQQIPDIAFFPFNYATTSWGIEISHIVMIAVDFRKKEVIYYDSQGLNSDGRNDYYSGFKMSDELKLIKFVCFGEDPTARILDTEFVHQEESHNCGVYILHFAERMLNGESFEHFQRRKIPFAEIEKIRADYAKRAVDFHKIPEIPTS